MVLLSHVCAVSQKFQSLALKVVFLIAMVDVVIDKALFVCYPLYHLPIFQRLIEMVVYLMELIPPLLD